MPKEISANEIDIVEGKGNPDEVYILELTDSEFYKLTDRFDIIKRESKMDTYFRKML